jgi:hypothetical protein
MNLYFRMKRVPHRADLRLSRWPLSPDAAAQTPTGTRPAQR